MSFTLNYTGDEINAILARANNGGEIDDELALKAPLASPALTGTPTAPTQPEEDNSTKIATTEYADRAADAAEAAAEAAAKEYTDEATSALYITDTASGSIASFSDGADGVAMRSVVVNITPVQSGSGDPSPDNVRPISGWTGAAIPVTGINVWDEEWELGNFDPTGQPVSSSAQIRTKNYTPCLPTTAYYCVAPSSAANLVFYYYDKDKQFVGYAYVNNNRVFTTPSNARYLKFKLATVYGTVYNNNVSVNYPSSDHDYHAYAGQTYSVSWQTQAGEVFGGTIDVVSGELKVTHAVVDLGTLTWTLTSWNGWRSNTINSMAVGPIDDTSSFISEKYASLPYASVYAKNIGVALGSSGNTKSIFVYSGDTVNTPTGRLVIPLAQPVTHLLLPQQITSLLGSNNVWSNTGDVEVEYVADPKLYIAKMLGGGALGLGSASPLSVNRPVTISEEDLEQAGDVSEAVEAAAETALPAETGEQTEEA